MLCKWLSLMTIATPSLRYVSKNIVVKCKNIPIDYIMLAILKLLRANVLYIAIVTTRLDLPQMSTRQMRNEKKTRQIGTRRGGNMRQTGKTRQTDARLNGNMRQTGKLCQTDARRSGNVCQTGKTRQTAACRSGNMRQTGKTHQTVARRPGIAQKLDAPN